MSEIKTIEEANYAIATMEQLSIPRLHGRLDGIEQGVETIRHSMDNIFLQQKEMLSSFNDTRIIISEITTKLQPLQGLDIKHAVVESKLNIMGGMMYAIGVAVVGMITTSIMGLFNKH